MTEEEMFELLQDDKRYMASYDELPKSLKQSVQSKITPDIIRIFFKSLSKDSGENSDLIIGLPDSDIEDIIYSDYKIYELYKITAYDGNGNSSVYPSFTIPLTAFQEAVMHSLQGHSGKYQIIPSDKDYKFSTTSKVNNKAYISCLEEEQFNKLVFDSETGFLTFDGTDEQKENQFAEIVKWTKQGLKKVDSLDLPILRQIFTMFSIAKVKSINGMINVNVRTFCEVTGIRYQSGNIDNINDVWSKINSFRNCIGIIDNRYYIPVLVFMGGDKATGNILLSSPFYYVLNEILLKKNTKKNPQKEEQYLNPFTCTLIKPTLISERKKNITKEILTYIMIKLASRGKKSDKQLNIYKDTEFTQEEKNIHTIRIQITEIIENVPSLYNSIDAIKTSSNKNRSLANAFAPLE